MSGWCGPERMYLVKTICFRQDKPRSRTLAGNQCPGAGIWPACGFERGAYEEEPPVLGRSTLQVPWRGWNCTKYDSGQAQFLADIRIVPPLNEKEVLNRLECLIEKRCEVYNGGLSFTPEISNYRMPVETGPKNQWLHRLKGFIGDNAGETGINYFTDASIS